MTRLSEQQFSDLQRRRGAVDVSAPPFKLPANQAAAFALGRLPVGTMNRTEAAYDAHLQAQHHTGAVLWHKFEGIKLRLADNTFYTPDFFVMRANYFMECHEIKGFMRDDANVKIKVAASIYPFKFIIVRKRKLDWDFEEKS